MEYLQVNDLFLIWFLILLSESEFENGTRYLDNKIIIKILKFIVTDSCRANTCAIEMINSARRRCTYYSSPSIPAQPCLTQLPLVINLVIPYWIIPWCIQSTLYLHFQILNLHIFWSNRKYHSHAGNLSWFWTELDSKVVFICICNLQEFMTSLKYCTWLGIKV